VLTTSERELAEAQRLERETRRPVDRQTQARSGLFDDMLATVIIAVGSVLLQGFHYPRNNNALQVPLVLDFAGSIEGPHDWFHGALTRYTSFLWPALSLVTTETSIHWVFLAGHLVTRAAFVFLLIRLVRSLAGPLDRPFYAWVAVAMLAGFGFRRSPLGGNEVFAEYLTQSEVVMPFLMASWLLALRRRWIASAVAVGLAVNVSLLAAVWAGAVLVAAAAWSERHGGKAHVTRLVAKLGLVMTVLALPTAVWVGTEALRAPIAATPVDYRLFISQWFPDHWYVTAHLTGTGLSLCLIAALVVLLGRFTILRTPGSETVLRGLVGGLCGVIGFGMVLPYLTGNAMILNLQPLRMDAYLIFLLLIALLASVWFEVGSVRQVQRAPFSVVALTGLVTGNVLVMLMALAFGERDTPGWRRLVTAGLLAAVAAAVVGVGLVPLWGGLERWATWPAVVAMALGWSMVLRGERDGALLSALLVYSLVLAELARGEASTPVLAGLIACSIGMVFVGSLSSRTMAVIGAIALGAFLTGIATMAERWVGDPIAVGAIAVAGASPIVGLGPLGKRRPPLAAVTGFGVVLAVLLMALGVRACVTNGCPIRTTDNLRAWRRVQEWVRAHTPPGTVLLTPTEQLGFSLFARRSTWVDWKSGSAVALTPSLYWTWRRRYTEVRRLETTFDLLSYARAHSIPYIVVELARHSLPRDGSVDVLYENRRFAVIAAR